MLRFSVLTAFPEMFPGSLAYSIIGKAYKTVWDIETISLKQFANQHHRIDDKPYGGGPGMVISPLVIEKALQSISLPNKDDDDNNNDDIGLDVIVCLSANGSIINQQYVKNISKYKNIGILCGRYEGIDCRVIKKYNMHEKSIGDFVLCGGEAAALLLMEAVIRILKGVVGNEDSLHCESYENYLLEFPQYTYPSLFHQQEVPNVLLTGHQKKIDQYRHRESMKLTMKNRPDLFAKYVAHMMQK